MSLVRVHLWKMKRKICQCVNGVGKSWNRRKLQRNMTSIVIKNRSITKV